jgi:hypothetical protein
MAWAILLCAVVVASFDAGVFSSKQTAVTILKYGVPGFFALVLLCLLVKLAWLGSKAIWKSCEFLLVVFLVFRRVHSLGGKF